MQHAIANELNGSLRWIRGGENQILRKRNETQPPADLHWLHCRGELEWMVKENRFHSEDLLV